MHLFSPRALQIVFLSENKFVALPYKSQKPAVIDLAAARESARNNSQQFSGKGNRPSKKKHVEKTQPRKLSQVACFLSEMCHFGEQVSGFRYGFLSRAMI